MSPFISDKIKKYLPVFFAVAIFFSIITLDNNRDKGGFFWPNYLAQADMDLTMAGQALALNSGMKQTYWGHPAHHWVILMSYWTQLTSVLGINETYTFDHLKASTSFAESIAPVIYSGRMLSSFLAIIFALSFGYLLSKITQAPVLSWSVAFLFSLSHGLIYLSLFLRTELLSALFSSLAILSIVRMYYHPQKNNFWTFFIYGFFIYAAAGTKIQTIPTALFGFFLLSLIIMLRGNIEIEPPVFFSKIKNKNIKLTISLFSLLSISFFFLVAIQKIFLRSHFEQYHLLTILIILFPFAIDAIKNKNIKRSGLSIFAVILGLSISLLAVTPWWEGAAHHCIFNYFECIIPWASRVQETDILQVINVMFQSISFLVKRTLIGSPLDNPIIIVNWGCLVGFFLIVLTKDLKKILFPLSIFLFSFLLEASFHARGMSVRYQVFVEYLGYITLLMLLYELKKMIQINKLYIIGTALFLGLVLNFNFLRAKKEISATTIQTWENACRVLSRNHSIPMNDFISNQKLPCVLYLKQDYFNYIQRLQWPNK